jgi:DNA mismatch repair protein MutS2
MESGGLAGREVEWDEVRSLLAAETATPMGRDRAAGCLPLHHPDAVAIALEETRQARAALAACGPPPWASVPDVRPALARCRTERAVLDGAELATLIPVLEVGARLQAYGKTIRSLAPALGRLAADLPRLDRLHDQLRRALTDDGALTDEASPALSRIRHRLRTLQHRIVRDLEALFQASDADRLFADRFVTRRNGRYVVPVRAEARARIRGIIHDRSQSGQTVFLEPDRVIETNNDLVQQVREEEVEALRILAELTESVSHYLPELDRLLESIAELDWIIARARLADRMNGTRPTLDPDGVRIQNARHPLLVAQSWREPARPVVPVDLELSRDRPLLVLTGPNAGGKTIALKTLGLLTLMAQVGCHIPAAEGSRLPVVSKLFAVIGDDQSVAENLSTFSAFVRQIRAVLEQVDAGSLVLLDELGAGTDPDEGAALAQAILEALADRGALVMATTHLEPLKAFASTHPRARNASVEFDGERLAPTFRLSYDHPGQSYALAIAARFGLPADLIARAHSHRSEHGARLGELLARLDAHSRTEAELRLAAEQQAAAAARAVAAAAAELERARQQARELTGRARQEAAQLVADVRRAVAGEWDRLRRTAPTRATLEAARRRLRDIGQGLAPSPEPEPPPEAPLAPGDMVEARHLGLRGRLAAISGDLATVQGGAVTARVPIQGLRKVATAQASSPVSARVPAKPDVAPELHLLGRTSEDARGLVEKYLDDAFLAGLASVRLVHGKGSGALRKAVHDVLTGHPLVDSFRTGEPYEGGTGATVAMLKVS